MLRLLLKEVGAISRKFYNGIDLQSQKIVSLADPTAATDGATKQYVDNLVNGLSYKNEVRAATTTNGTLATAFANGQAIDGVTLATGDRILIKNQTTQTENGIYVVAASGAPSRATDADSTTDLNNATVYVTSGTTLSGTEWTQTTASPTIGSSNIVWGQKSSGSSYTAGSGLTESPALTFNVAAGDTSITVAADSISVNPAASGGLTVSSGLKVDSTVARVFETGTHASSTSIAITHSLGKQFVCAHVFVTSTGEEIFPDVTATSTTVTTFAFGSAPTANSLTFKICA